MLMLTLATLPNPAEFMVSVGAWSSPLFSDLLPFATFAVGLILGVFLIGFVVRAVKNLTDKE